MKCPRRDSNPRPTVPETGALSPELRRRTATETTPAAHPDPTRRAAGGGPTGSGEAHARDRVEQFLAHAASDHDARSDEHRIAVDTGGDDLGVPAAQAPDAPAPLLGKRLAAEAGRRPREHEVPGVEGREEGERDVRD